MTRTMLLATCWLATLAFSLPAADAADGTTDPLVFSDPSSGDALLNWQLQIACVSSVFARCACLRPVSSITGIL